MHVYEKSTMNNFLYLKELLKRLQVLQLNCYILTLTTLVCFTYGLQLIFENHGTNSYNKICDTGDTLIIYMNNYILNILSTRTLFLFVMSI